MAPVVCTMWISLLAFAPFSPVCPISRAGLRHYFAGSMRSSAPSVSSVSR
jgi:hypothetical protein